MSKTGAPNANNDPNQSRSSEIFEKYPEIKRQILAKAILPLLQTQAMNAIEESEVDPLE